MRFELGSLLVLLVTLVLGACEKKDAGAGTTRQGSEIEITVDAVGYHPSEARAPAGKPVRLVFTRTTEDGCGEELLVPSLGIKKELPVNQPVPIDLTMPSSGKLAFTCGMDMMHGTIVAE
jgi:plastocyanin domain-containing protein